ncbi:hypothetical protein TNCV_180861 [Trichonephila clavipes]|nr:hypothetical protein TNCV_180861 [Trichonephila clavipes]
MVETTPSLSTRGIANENFTIRLRILDDSALHPFHYQYVQSLKECDCTSSGLSTVVLAATNCKIPFFEASVLFTDEASFSREGIFNTHNNSGSSNRTLHSAWSPDWSTLPDMEQVLPKLLDRAHVTAATRTSMWFQQDGAPAHFSISVRNHGCSMLNDGLWRSSALISPIARPFLSGLWGQMKSLCTKHP